MKAAQQKGLEELEEEREGEGEGRGGGGGGGEGKGGEADEEGSGRKKKQERGDRRNTSVSPPPLPLSRRCTMMSQYCILKLASIFSNISKFSSYNCHTPLSPRTFLFLSKR